MKDEIKGTCVCDNPKTWKDKHDTNKCIECKKEVIPVMNDFNYTKQVEYVKNNFSQKCTMLDFAAKHITKRWAESNVENVFTVVPSVIYFSQSYRLKVTIESVINGKNIIFYSRQEAISEILWQHKKELRDAIQDFVFSVMGDLMEKGMESLRIETILNKRSRMYEGTLPKIENECYPCTVEEMFVPGTDEAEIVNED